MSKSNNSTKSARRTVKSTAKPATKSSKATAKPAAATAVTTGAPIAKLTPKAASNVNATIEAGLKTGQRKVDVPKGGKGKGKGKAAKPAKPAAKSTKAAPKAERRDAVDLEQVVRISPKAPEAREGSFNAVAASHAGKPISLAKLIDRIVSDKVFKDSRRADDNSKDELVRVATVRVRHMYGSGKLVNAK